MKKNEKEEFQKLTNQEIIEKVFELKKKLFNLRCQKSMNQLINPMQICKIKKTIALLLTLLKSKEIVC
ncbi:MAG: 50S ribosomal protein L29 [Clostridiales bacterium]|nr:50S ribosomal protein L29 [Clostridiales bacterium]